MEQRPEGNGAVSEAEKQKERSSVFRQKSIDRISSPEQLNDYVRVASPRMWIVLVAVVVFLAGIFIWSMFCTVESTIYGVVIGEKGTCTLYRSEEEAEIIEPGDIVIAKDTDMIVKEVSAEPFMMTESFPGYARDLGGFSMGEWIYTASIEDTTLPDGIYRAAIAEEIITPISLLTETE